MPHLLILTADTGGGHRAVAEALKEAVKQLDTSSQRFTIELCDFTEMAIPPWNHSGIWYGWLTLYSPWLYKHIFYATIRPFIRRQMERLTDFALETKMTRFLKEGSFDLVVSVHAFATRLPQKILRAIRPEIPFVTVVTDLMTAHPLWYWYNVDRMFVPCEEVYERASQAGVLPSKIEITGLPINPRFAQLRQTTDKKSMKSQYGMPIDRPLLLLMGGAEGVGNLAEYAQAITSSNLPLSLMVITGRNKRLAHRLEQQTWPIPTQIAGFVHDIPDRMAAADLLITKAGPSTICEGLAMGLPILVSGFLPGQEEGNVRWITENKAGYLINNPNQMTNTLHDLFNAAGATALYEKTQQAAFNLARPDAALTVARRLMEMADRAAFSKSPDSNRWRGS